MQHKQHIYIALDGSGNKSDKNPKYLKTLIVSGALILITASVVAFICAKPVDTTTSNAMSSNGMSKAAITDWNDCNAGDACLSSGFICCVAPADLSSGKKTCRPNTSAQCAASGSVGGGKGPVSDWNDCSSGDTCASSGFTCCIAPGDLASGKKTCRPNNSQECSNGSPPPTTKAPVADWNDCASADTCASSGFICCVAPGDLASGKKTCRPNTSAQCSNGSPPPPTNKAAVADWNDCAVGDSCASSTFICCVAPADLTSGKKTCRPNTFAQCSNGSPPPPAKTAVADWNDCAVGDTCSSSTFVCCVAPGDFASGKKTCRPNTSEQCSNGTPPPPPTPPAGACISGSYGFSSSVVTVLGGAGNVVQNNQGDYFSNLGWRLDLKKQNGQGASGATMTSSFKMLYGKASLTVKSIPVPGVVTTFITINELGDEIDFEMTGSTTHVTTNFFHNSLVSGVDPEYGQHDTSFYNDQSVEHRYTIDWKRDLIVWSVDGQVIRSLSRADAKSVKTGQQFYPVTPSFIQFGLWDTSSFANGTNSWSGGPMVWPQGVVQYSAFYKDLDIQCYDENNQATAFYPKF